MVSRRGLSLFAILSVFGMIGVFFLFTDTAPVHELTGRIEVFYLLLCILGAPVADWIISGFRMWLFTSKACPSVSYRACVKNCAVGAFMSAATPSQTGGGVAQVYVLSKEGANGGQALNILFITFLSTLVFYTLVSLVVLTLAATGRLPDTGVSGPFVAAALVFVVLTVGGLFIVAYPDGFQRLVAQAANRAQGRRYLEKPVTEFSRLVDEGTTTAKTLIRSHTGRFIVSIPITLLIFGNKYMASYVATLALGLDPPLMELIAVQVFLNVVLYFFPTPGSSGGAEMGTALLMAPLVPSSFLAAYTLIWRTGTMYLSVLVGGILLALYIRGDRVRSVE